MRICLVYDCLFPWTIGGAERWMRSLADALLAEGHELTYLTRRQWPSDDPPRIEGVKVVAVSREEPLYGPDGNRTIGEPLRFGLGVLAHLARHGRDYDVVHTASFPYFSLLAAGALRRARGYRLLVDWHEVWSDEYWQQYLGGARGRLAQLVQRACARTRQRAFCFSQLHARRLREIGLAGEVTVLRGEWAGSLDRPDPRPAEMRVVFAGRLIPEKQAPLVVAAVMRARARVPGLTATVFGDGPQLAEVRAAIARAGAQEVVDAPGFVESARVQQTLATALCLLLPSVREGYGMVVVEACAAGVPSVLVSAPDNAAAELIEPGVNGFLAASSDDADELASLICAVADAGEPLRASTADWFAEHAQQLSVDASLRAVTTRY